MEKIDDTVRKFISGEIIIDKENPFKKLNAKRRADFFSSTPSNLQKVRESPRVTFALDDLPKDDEFISKEDVLKESKYVRTYIKHPDEYFVYDPTLKERLLKEERLELAAKNRSRNSPPRKVNGTRISKSTQERLNELKNRYSPSNLNYTYNQPKPRNHITNGHANGYIASKLPTLQNKKDRSKYPDLSQIKVKTGTDLEGSLFNPKEVAINAKKFDARIKNTQFGSQDDLDEIADLTSDFDANGFDVIDTTVEEKPKENKSEGTLTNTINSKEFQKYLAEKGLILQPQLHLIEQNTKMATPNGQIEVDVKKARKPSVLQRLFPSGFFSSRRRTTPKESTPTPINVQANEPKKSGRLASARRLVLHRQSMPATVTDAYVTKSNLKSTSALSGSSSSISSTLTNVENSDYLESYRANCNKALKSKSNDSETTRSLSGLRYIDSSSNSTIVTCDKNKNADQQTQCTAAKPIPRPRQLINGKPASISQSTPVLSKTSKETPICLQRSQPSTENRDRECGIKTRARPKIPISNIRPLVNHRADGKSDQTDEKRVNGLTNDVAKRRLASKLPERLIKVPANIQSSKRNVCETSFDVRNDVHANRNEAKTPDNLNDSKAPKSTSTPISEGQPPKFSSETKTKRSPNVEGVSLEQSLNISPIPKQNDTLPRRHVHIDAATWAKVQELKEKADRLLYSQPPLLVQAHVNTQPIAYSSRIMERPQPIYDRLPAHNNMVASQPLYAKVEKKSSMPPINAQFVRNAPYRQSLDQIRFQTAVQHQQTVNPAIYYHQPVFVRNSPQRNTISGVYRGNMQRISPQTPQTPITMVQAQQQQQLQQQPQRPQSVLDEMMTGRAPPSAPSPNIQMRRNPLSRNDIMNQVIEFCRKSMNKTPTRFFRGVSNEQVATVHKDATSSEVSPISYSSVTASKTSPSIASSRSGKIGPQVPIRKQSLPQLTSTDQLDQHPIYEHIPKHNKQTPTPPLNDENKPVNGIISHYAVPPKRYMVVDSEHLTSAHVKQYQQINGSHSSLNQPVYISPAALKSFGRTNQDHGPYEYVRVRSDSNSSLGNNLLQIYHHPNTPTKQTNTVVDRRFAPIIMPTIPQHQQINGNANAIEVQLPPGYTKSKVIPKHGRIVMLNNIEQMYRPIAVHPKHVRYQTSQTSLDSRQSSDTIDSIQQHKREVIAKSEYIYCSLEIHMHFISSIELQSHFPLAFEMQ